MQLNYLALAVPLFLGLMLIEYMIARKKGKKFFIFTKSIANINVGIAERLLDTLVIGSFYLVYDYLQRHYGIFDIKPSLLLWIALLIATDFTWYWYHRLAHEINIFWAAHIVHHQSEDFNYTVSARITVFQAVIRTGFWCVLPLVGFPAGMITTVLLVHGLYPFFIHTRLVGKMGILEYILVTPSHHRVHHASNPEYLDKNYGDVFIIWDKLFGTFRKEQSEIVFGLTKPLKTNSFLWQHCHYILELIVAARRAEGFPAKLRVLFGRPDSINPAIRETLEKKFGIRNSYQSASRELNRYVVLQIAVALTLLFMFILLEHFLGWPLQMLITLFILITLVNCGAILEQRRWIFYLEYTRALIVLIALLTYHPSPLFLSVALLLVPLSGLYFDWLQTRYLRWVYPYQRLSKYERSSS